MEIPVYLFTGFFESGKTRFVQETMEDERFNSGEKTLMIICESGIEEYDETKYPFNNVDFVTVKNEADINPKNFRKWEKEYKPEKVVVEYNGMWLVDNLYKNLPPNWQVYQEMFFANAMTFIPYNNNMRQLTVDKLRGAELVVLNRAEDSIDTQEVHKIVRGVSKRAQIAYEFSDGRVAYDDIEDPLPYDIDADVIEVKDEDYAVFYRDINEEINKYIGKTVKFKGICAKEKDMPKDTFIAGRHVMTCCIDDIQYLPFVCISDSADKIKSRDWKMITGTVEFEHNKLYDGKGPVLRIKSVAVTTKPEDEVAVFY